MSAHLTAMRRIKGIIIWKGSIMLTIQTIFKTTCDETEKLSWSQVLLETSVLPYPQPQPKDALDTAVAVKEMQLVLQSGRKKNREDTFELHKQWLSNKAKH